MSGRPSAALYAYHVQLADVLDPHEHYPSRRLRVHVGADHCPDDDSRCPRCRTMWPCRVAVELGRLQGLAPPDEAAS